MTITRPDYGLGFVCLFLAGAVCLGHVSAAQARITRIEITSVQSPTFDGAAFGSVGQYEKLVGRVYGEVDPSDPLNAVITDIK